MANSTYSGDPSMSASDRVRFEVGDTDCDNAALTDEEIAVFVDEGGDTLLAASKAAEALAAKYAIRVDESIGGTSKSYSQLSEHYTQLAVRLRRRAGASPTPVVGVAPYAGGLSDDEKSTDRIDTDLIQPTFAKDILRDPHNSDVPHGHDIED